MGGPPGRARSDHEGEEARARPQQSLGTGGTGAVGSCTGGRLVSAQSNPSRRGAAFPVDESVGAGGHPPPDIYLDPPEVPEGIAAEAAEHAPGIVYVAVADRLWSPLWLSPRVREATGFEPDELQEDPALWISQIHPDDRERVLMERFRAVEREGPFRAEYRWRTREGGIRWFHDEAVIRRDGGRSLVHGVVLDVSDRKRCDDVLDRLYDSARQVARELRATEEARNAFFQLFVHDVRHPLGETLERIEKLLRDDGGTDVRGQLEAVATTLARANELMTDVLDLERLDSDHPTLQAAPTRLAELVGATIDDLGDVAGDVKLDVQRTVVVVDAAVVRQGLAKLVHNALVHTPVGTRVSVHAGRHDQGVLLRVVDDGPGIPDQIKREIFEPFARGEAPASRPGLGLGLAVVARLARLHGGRVWVEDTPGGGASFHLLVSQL